MPSSSRRAFLIGRAAAAEAQAAGERLARRAADGSRVVPSVGDTIRLETRAMACHWQVMIPADPTIDVMAVSDVLDRVHELETVMTVYREDGELRQLNETQTTEPVAISPALADALAIGIAQTRATGGCFDLTAGPLIDLWQFARSEERAATKDEIAEARSRCGVDRLELDREAGTIRRRQPGMVLNLGGIGKGIALDVLADELRSLGLRDFLVHGGRSSVLACGRCGTGNGWPVALRNPLEIERPLGTVLLQNEALSSSGSNVQFYRVEGRRYGHLLDPRIGQPADAALSATVCAATAAAADALSTAFFVGGLDFASPPGDTSHPSSQTDEPKPGSSVRPGGAAQPEGDALELAIGPDVSVLLTPAPTGRTLQPIAVGPVFADEADERFFPAPGLRFSEQSAVERPAFEAN